MPGILPPGNPIAVAPKKVVTPTQPANPFAPGIVGAPGVTDPLKQPINTAKDPTTAMQQFLKNRGYDITVDGNRGPLTNAAVLAFHNKISPQAFNAKYGKGPKVVASTTPTVTPTTSTPNNNSADTSTNTSLTPDLNPATTTSNPFAAPNIPAINPQVYATGATNAVYDPQIAALAQQITQGKAQGTQDQKDISNWYKQLQNLAAQMNSQTKTDDTNAQNSYDTNSSNALSQLFGGSASPAAAEAASYHDIQSGGLAANNSADQNFNDRMRTILQATQAQSSKDQLNKDNTNVQGLNSQLVALKGAKGQAYDANLQTGYQNATQQASAIQAAKLAAALAPSQIASATATATTDLANAASAPALVAANLKLAQANVAKVTAAAKASTGAWNLNLPAQRGSLTSALKQSIQGPNGGFKVDPSSAFTNIQAALTEAGLQNDPQAKQIADSIMAETFATAHSNKKWGGYQWGYGKVLQTNQHFDPKTGKLVSNKK